MARLSGVVMDGMESGSWSGVTWSVLAAAGWWLPELAAADGSLVLVVKMLLDLN